MFKDLSDEEKRLAFSTPEYFGGETHEQLCSRVLSFFKEIENSTENILIVSHGGIYRALYKYLNNLDSLEFNLKPIPNAEIVLLKH
jgi:broad specificity phosphatase PhoE